MAPIFQLIVALAAAVCAGLSAVLAGPSPAVAQQALAAVATNFAAPAARLAADFAAAGGGEVRLSFGSAGKLYAQIVQGGPFDLFLSADAERPALLIENGLAVADSRFTFAFGRLALIRHDGGPAGLSYLKEAEFRRLAIANPRLAPYGLAAEQVLSALGLQERLRGRMVFGENVGQAFAMVATGNAEAGLVALSLVEGPRWPVPAELHAPIRQDAVLLARAVGNETARAFLAYLRSDEGRETIRRFGYDLDEAAGG